MNYLSVCSGIEAATVAWHHMGWNPVGFSEIEKFPSQVLAHHYPQVTNFGDMTKYKEWEIDRTIGLLVGGTPCQSFSVAGLRKGLEDPRGNLALTYVGILDHFRPKWFIWENVPGVLSSKGGRDFGSFLGALGELGYGFAYRVLDAQHYGVPQRRRRVFVVGCLGDWRPAAEVLFESDCLRRDTKKGRKKGETVTSYTVPSVANCLQTTCNDYSRADGFNMICTEHTGPLTARDYKGISSDDCNPTMMKLVAYENHPSDSRVKEMGDVCQTVTSSWGTGGGNIPFVQNIAYGFEPGIAKREGNPNRFSENISPTLRASISDNQASVACIGGQHPNAAIGENISPTLTNAMGSGGGHIPIVQSFGWQNSASQSMSVDSISPTLDKSKTPAIVKNMAVRRLTPVECERLQGFPDNYTNIKENCPDGARYKALGNSMAVPVMRWIGERINLYETMRSPTTMQMESRLGFAEV
jgi:DNA (cytosine-5)-methyltransferase 1